MPKDGPHDDGEPSASHKRPAGKPYAGNQPGRVQFSACGGCRHRRVKCDLKDKIARFPDVDPATLQCSNCIERRFECVDEYAQTKAKKQLRKGRRLLEVKARYGERDAVQHPHPADLQIQQSAAIPRLHPDFFNSRFFGRFQIQRPVLHPVEFSTKYCNWLETGDRAVLSREGELIGMVLAAWAASYGIDAAGNAEPHLGDESVSARKERTKEMMREILHLVDVFGILRKPDWDGVRALLLIMPLTEEVIDPLERLTIYEAAVAQVYTLCRIADVHTIRGGGDDSTKHHVRARIFWYAHVHEGITTGLKGGRLILQQEDIDAFNKEDKHVNPANAHALVMGASTSDRFAFRFATIPIRIAAACRKIHAALTGPRAKGKTDVDRGKLNDAWEALDTSYEELDTIIREIPPTELRSVEDISRFAHGWKIFIYECQNRILNGLEDKVRDLKQQPLTSHIEEVIDDADLARQESHYANILRDNQHLVEIARSKCLNLAHEVAALVRQYLGSSFFEYDAALVRDGSFYAGYLLADEPGCEEQVNDCLRAMDEMRWAFSKSAQYREDLKMKMDARALRERQAIQQLAAANNGPSPPSGSDYSNSLQSSGMGFAHTSPPEYYITTPDSSTGGSSQARSVHSQSPKGMPVLAQQHQQQHPEFYQQQHVVPVAQPASVALAAQQLQPTIPMQLPGRTASAQYHPAPLPYPIHATTAHAAPIPAAHGRPANITITPQATMSRSSSSSHISPIASIPPAPLPQSSRSSDSDGTTRQMFYLQQQGRQLAQQQQQTVAMFQQLQQQPAQQGAYHPAPPAVAAPAQSLGSVQLSNPYPQHSVQSSHELYPQQQAAYTQHPSHAEHAVQQEYSAPGPSTSYGHYYDLAAAVQPAPGVQYQILDETPTYASVPRSQEVPGAAGIAYFDPNAAEYESQYFYPPGQAQFASTAQLQQTEFAQDYSYPPPQQ
ncbi:hypothetical protein EXIGLDRAFT_768129 [Exidia glandulosa HHB12029]|uniref:Zn(2)-C6 fungal-type domain-containing protein n=1 Tax=Exidia glandulosa HHB12029 TaxID=1314781 RepID=A0A165IG30_EXIGL|nr:hypothetical protein EXIGLDRAFT_768129 [Exidia glandulosa HHB12029]